MKKLLLFTLIAGGLLVGCEAKKEVTEIQKEEGYLLDIDNYGRNITFDKVPTKVLTLGPNCTELFVELGLEEYVIGRSLVNHSRGPLKEIEEAVDNIPIINYAEVTRESVLTSGADFIYAIDWEISDVGCNIEEAENYGMEVYVNSAKTIEEQYKEIQDIGKIFQIEKRAESFINDQKERIKEVENKVAGKEPIKVLVYDAGNDGVFTATGTNFETFLIEASGGKNIFDDITDKQWATVGYEDILKRNPEVILIHDYDSITFQEKVEEIKNSPILSELDCVKNERFVKIDLESVLPGNRMANTIEYFYESFER